jgi:hypothetical protein
LAFCPGTLSFFGPKLIALNFKHVEKFFLEVGAINVARFLDGPITGVAHVSGLGTCDAAYVLIDLIPNELAGSFPYRPEDLVYLVFGLQTESFVGVGRIGVDTEGEIDRNLHVTIENSEVGTTILMFVMNRSTRGRWPVNCRDHPFFHPERMSLGSARESSRKGSIKANLTGLRLV